MRVNVYAEGVRIITHRGGGTSSSAGIRSARCWSADGKPPNVNGGCVKLPTVASGTGIVNANDVTSIVRMVVTLPPPSQPLKPLNRPLTRVVTLQRYPENFCDRPGCYDPVRASRSKAAKYCSDGCRRAVHRVRDRERKWLKRHALAKQILRATHGCRQSRMPINQLPNFGIHEPASMQPPPSDQFFNYGNPGNSDLSSETIQRRKTDGYQRDSGSKSRAPPAAE